VTDSDIVSSKSESRFQSKSTGFKCPKSSQESVFTCFCGKNSGIGSCRILNECFFIIGSFQVITAYNYSVCSVLDAVG